MKASAQSSRSFFVWGRLILAINFSLATAKVFVHLLGKVPPSRGLTHMRSMCVGVAETGVEHRSPAKKHEETFPFSRFLVTKSAAKVSKEDSRRPPSEPLAACTS